MTVLPTVCTFAHDEWCARAVTSRMVAGLKVYRKHNENMNEVMLALGLLLIAIGIIGSRLFGFGNGLTRVILRWVWAIFRLDQYSVFRRIQGGKWSLWISARYGDPGLWLPSGLTPPNDGPFVRVNERVVEYGPITLIGRLLCRCHNLRHFHNTYGDEINAYDGVRSLWECMDCGRTVPSYELGPCRCSSGHGTQHPA